MESIQKITKQYSLSFNQKVIGVEMKSIKLTILLFIFLLYGFLNNSTAQWVQVSNGMGNVIVISIA